MNRPLSMLMFFVLLSSCIKVVELDVEDLPVQLVVNCFFTENEPFKVNVSRLVEYPDLSNRNIDNAQVLIFENNNLLGQLNHISDSIYTNSSIIPKRGHIYKIEVEVPGYPTAIATDNLPLKVPINNCTYKLEAGIDGEGDSYDQLIISFNDIDSADFYSIQVFNIWEKGVYNETMDFWEYIPVWYPIELFSQDPAIVAEGTFNDEYPNYLVFNDALFKNKTYNLLINTYYDIEDHLRIILETGTEDYYLYRKRLIKHEPYSYQDPFKPYDPVQLYSNIENGLGIFAGYQRDIFDLTIAEN